MKQSFTNKLKLALAVFGITAIGTTTAQTTTGNVGKQAEAALGASTGYVKVIDNKGTIKYLQSTNGITQFTDNAPDGGIVTTWQLGGALTSATNITTGGNEFKITISDAVAGPPAVPAGTFVIDGVVQETGTAATAATLGTSGWTLLVRDEATGQVKKLLADSIVSGIRLESPRTANATTGTTNITVNGLPVLNASTTAAKLFVYRNGAKLRYDTDFTVTADTVTFNHTNVPFYNGDIIEIQYIK